MRSVICLGTPHMPNATGSCKANGRSAAGPPDIVAIVSAISWATSLHIIQISCQ